MLCVGSVQHNCQAFRVRLRELLPVVPAVHLQMSASLSECYRRQLCLVKYLAVQVQPIAQSGLVSWLLVQVVPIARLGTLL